MASRLAKGGACVALACAVVGGAEGLRQMAYPDPATRGEPWTICYGHTGHVTPGDKKSLAECKQLLINDMETAALGVESCVTVKLPDARYVALLSLAYNIGAHAVCHSSIVKNLNAGHTRAACEGFLAYDHAAGIVMPGLTRRREQERLLCLEGLD